MKENKTRISAKNAPKTSAKKTKQVKPQYIPHVTEKSYAEQAKHVYVFKAPANLSKQAIAKAISSEFNVTVKAVRTVIRKGKPTRFSRGKHAYPGITTRRDQKIAYVTVGEQDKIPVFEKLGKEIAAANTGNATNNEEENK